jgi:hypothetical protein
MTRDIRRELRSIRKDVDNADDPSFDDGDIATVVDGLTSDDGRTRSSAARTLHESPSEIVPGETLRDPLVETVEAGIEDEGKQARRAAEKASRVLGEYQLETRTVDDELTALAERMVEVRNPFLRTGGAALLGPALVVGEVDVGEDVIASLSEHITMSELLVESFERKLDNLQPVFLVFTEVDDAHSEAVADSIETAAIETYLHTHHENARGVTARLLRSVAATEPETVAQYTLDLILRLRDDASQAALHAGRALAELADEQGVAPLRPTTQILPQALETTDPDALTGVVELLVTVVEADPEWTTDLPVERVSDLQTSDAVADRPRLRSKLAATLGRYAKSRDRSVIGEGFPEFVLGTVTVDPAEDASLPNPPQLGLGLADALTAAPTTFVPATLAAGSGSVQNDLEDLADLSPLASFFGALASKVTTDGEADPSDELPLPEAYLLVALGFEQAIEADEAVAAELQSVATDETADRDARRLAAEMAFVSVGDDLDPSTATRLAALGGVAGRRRRRLPPRGR